MSSDVESLFRAHHRALFLYLVRLTGDPDLAADATQEAFVRMIEKRPADVNRRAWLFSVATNHVREVARTRARHRAIEQSAELKLTPDGPDPPDRLSDARIAADRVRRALDRLDARERTVLLMREEGFAHREIAQAVGTTTGSIGTMIARALGKLASILDAEMT